MTELAFPPPPLTIGQEYVGPNGVTYEWDGEAWVATAGTVAPLWTDNAASGLMSPANEPRSLSLYPASAIHFGDPKQHCPCILADANGLTFLVPSTVAIEIAGQEWATFTPGQLALIGRLVVASGPIVIGSAPSTDPATPGTISYDPDGHFRGFTPGGAVQLDGVYGAAGGDLSGYYPTPSLRPGLIPTTLPPSGPVPPGGALTGAYPSPGVDYTKITGTPAIPTTLPPSGAVPAGDLAGSSYPSPVIAPGAVTTAKIAAGVIPTTLPPSGPVPSGDLAGSTYPSPVVAPLAITTGKIARGAAVPVQATQAAPASVTLTATAAVLVETTQTLDQTRPVLVLTLIRLTITKTSGNNTSGTFTLRAAVGGTAASDGTVIATLDPAIQLNQGGQFVTTTVSADVLYSPTAAGATRFKIFAASGNTADYSVVVQAAQLTVLQLA
jgi:hypothetical protein